ncbi:MULTISPECIES: hypothetical protein [Pectobacterium]|uniref:Uncharacterized protein n=1 Tax=Pectobacterium parvum TaxID=2778550 RepID=A0AAP9IH55_9GAMM|nr:MULTISPECIES: hypothetical protein [Pectobacterium]GKW43678.1 hypothetical protein PEC301879_35360 [Pectobacterium carotovorum subsp. carotovorum]KFX10651.1 hypothetical protein KP17_17740 [Pectobacterium parvum]MCU1803498.1 hypothetical protein [Pectobacterium parvum]QHQ24354.1 hypothetical protein GMX10_09945 [Pectobacterium parvum]UVD98087.1 hypothetical protein NV347_03435 [Pectobacterium parvum]
MSSYNISVLNKSGDAANIAIYQTYPNVVSGLPLVWLRQTVNNGNTNTYNWTVDWALNWGTSEQPLAPGVQWNSGGPIQAMDPTTASGKNAMGVRASGGQFQTSPLAHNDRSVPSGSMLINTDSSFTVTESKALSFAVYMNSLPTFAMRGKPNGNFLFDTHPVYWICTTDSKQGVAVQGTFVSSPTQFSFPDGVTSLNFTLDETLKFVQS